MIQLLQVTKRLVHPGSHQLSDSLVFLMHNRLIHLFLTGKRKFNPCEGSDSVFKRRFIHCILKNKRVALSFHMKSNLQLKPVYFGARVKKTCLLEKLRFVS